MHSGGKEAISIKAQKSHMEQGRFHLRQKYGFRRKLASRLHGVSDGIQGPMVFAFLWGGSLFTGPCSYNKVFLAAWTTWQVIVFMFFSPSRHGFMPDGPSAGLGYPDKFRKNIWISLPGCRIMILVIQDKYYLEHFIIQEPAEKANISCSLARFREPCHQPVPYPRLPSPGRDDGILSHNGVDMSQIKTPLQPWAAVFKSRLNWPGWDPQAVRSLNTTWGMWIWCFTYLVGWTRTIGCTVEWPG